MGFEGGERSAVRGDSSFRFESNRNLGSDGEVLVSPGESQGFWVGRITVRITGPGVLTCKQTNPHASPAPVHAMVIRRIL